MDKRSAMRFAYGIGEQVARISRSLANEGLVGAELRNLARETVADALDSIQRLSVRQGRCVWDAYELGRERAMRFESVRL